MDYKKIDSLRKVIIGRLVEETQALTEIAASMAWAIQHEEYVQVDEVDNSEAETIEHLEQTLAHIPFVDYHAAVDEISSIVQVIYV